MIRNDQDLARIDFAKGDGLVPVIVQDAASARVLMLGYMNSSAAAETLRRGRVVFWSRSKNRLWEKGETSGHSLKLVSMTLDCDADTLLIRATPAGPVCHRGTTTCFDDVADDAVAAETLGFLDELEAIITHRMTSATDTSYTAKLLAAGPRRVAQKVGEEGVEVALAGAAGDVEELVSESADLLYHLIVMLKSRDLSLRDVTAELRRRHDDAVARGA
ncbi:MAG: bifunctional phosphoribosyl-AMP cyclohydrolase/phosphoribosyl-ATP diphosphatase HisIE [Gammaproteobacteria bacterium]|nr:bifunctional phosphoribosyl-AMP cyclohydrolase/phosphoribosyl-ATP diphosphatase HisIE [Gammaproteobacteria bacterium]